MIILKDVYPGRVFIDVFNPDGTFKDSTSPGALDGTPAQQAWARDMWAFLEILREKSGIVASGTPDTAAASQRYDALVKISRDLWPEWDSTHAYKKGLIVLASDETTYQSLQNANLNNNPVSSPAFWVQFDANIVSPATEIEQGISYLPGRGIVSNNGGNVDTIDFSPARFTFDDGSGEAVSQSILQKNMSVTWAAGNAGGLAPGEVPNDDAWHFFYKIYDPTNNTVDALATLNPISFNLPGTYTKKRYQGAMYRSPAGFWGFTQTDNRFDLKEARESFNAVVAVVAQTIELDVPPFIRVRAQLIAFLQLGGALVITVVVRFFPTDAVDLTVTNGNAQLLAARDGTTPDTWNQFGKVVFEVLSDPSAEINARSQNFPVQAATGITQLYTTGWIDPNLEAT